MGWPDAAVTIVFIVCLAVCFCWFMYLARAYEDDDESDDKT